MKTHREWPAVLDCRMTAEFPSLNVRTGFNRVTNGIRTGEVGQPLDEEGRPAHRTTVEFDRVLRTKSALWQAIVSQEDAYHGAVHLETAEDAQQVDLREVFQTTAYLLHEGGVGRGTDDYQLSCQVQLPSSTEVHALLRPMVRNQGGGIRLVRNNDFQRGLMQYGFSGHSRVTLRFSAVHPRLLAQSLRAFVWLLDRKDRFAAAGGESLEELDRISGKQVFEWRWFEYGAELDLPPSAQLDAIPVESEDWRPRHLLSCGTGLPDLRDVLAGTAFRINRSEGEKAHVRLRFLLP